MLVSIVVPAFNEEKYIGRCLRALVRQEHSDFEFEIIVVDDGSTDHTAEIARRAGREVRVITQARGGVSAARQAGFQAARGDMIASMDADSRPPRDWLVRLVDELQQAPDLVGVYGPIRLSDGKWYEACASHYVGGFYFWSNQCIGKPMFSGSNFAVRRAAWARVGGFDPAWASSEDTLLGLKLARVGRIRFCWDIVVPTSARRTREGYWGILKRSFLNYFRVMWFNAAPLPFADFR